MKHCPECLEEYRDDLPAETCPECGGTMLAGPSPRFSPEGVRRWGNFKPLTTLTEQWEADLLKGRLEADGLSPIQSPSAYYTQHNIAPVEVTTGITVLVRESEFDAACQIVNQINADAETELIFCPACRTRLQSQDERCPECGFDYGESEIEGGESGGEPPAGASDEP